MRRIWLSLFFVTLAAPAIRADVKIENVQRTYTPIGPIKPTSEYLPNSTVFMPFTVTGLEISNRQPLRLEVNVALISKRGKTVLAKTYPIKGTPTLRGTSAWCVAVLPLSAPLDSGHYTLRINVEDLQQNQADVVEKPITVIDRRLAFSSVGFYLDKKRTVPASSKLTCGQSLHLKARFVGLENAAGVYRANQTVSVLDAKTKEVLVSQDFPTRSKAPANQVLTFTGHLGLMTRPGIFILRIQLTDQIAQKSVSQDLSFEVLPR